MANGDLVRQPKSGESAVVFGPSVYNVSLLPYEKELIKTIGITEEEYKKFTTEVRRRGNLRPAEYAHIPDIRNDAVVTPLLVSLAVGLVFTGVAYLLTPKPKMPSAQQRRGGGSVDLGDITGANRFTPSRGFETLAELADYGSPVPIIFGRYDDEKKIGGMLVTPKLIWSRMFSHGTLQRAALVYVVGEQGLGLGIDPPELGGIFLGNNALDAIYENFFAFYWAKNSKDTPRIRVEDLRYGTRGTPDSGDPGAGLNSANAEVFVAPTPESTRDVAFCQAFSPTNNTQFGVYDPIANGTAYRLNYEIINIFNKTAEDDAKRGQALARLKIIGDKNYLKNSNSVSMGDEDHVEEIFDQKHRGKGRNYSPRMGIYKIKKGGTEYTITNNNLQRTINPIAIGDQVFFKISATKVNNDFYFRSGKGESVDDINSAVEELQLHADDSLTLGEQFEIGGCIFKVVSRSLDMFVPASGKDQNIVLECVASEFAYSQRVGMVNRQKVIAPNDDYIGDSYPGLDEEDNNVEESFYPLMRVAIAHVRNNRPAITTEIGLKSTVFQQLNGLCSFPSLPSPDEIQDYDESSVTVKTGRNSSYIARASIFRVFLRIAGDSDEKFRELRSGDSPMFFAVRGRRPIPQYTFLRFTLKQLEATALEFKFVQMSAASLLKVPDTQEIYDISQAQGVNASKVAQNITASVGGGIGNVSVSFPGSTIQKQYLLDNREFYRAPREITNVTSIAKPQSAEIVTNLPDPPVSGNVITLDSTLTKLSGQPGNIGSRDTGGLTGAFLYEIAKAAGYYATNTPLGTQVNFKTTEFIDDDPKKWVVCQWQLEVIKLDASHFAVANQGGNRRAWSIKRVKVRGSGPGFKNGETFRILRGQRSTEAHGVQANYGDDNPYRNKAGEDPLRWSGNVWVVPSVTFTETIVGRAQGYRHVVFGSAENYAVDTVRTITRTKTKESGAKSIVIELTSKVKTQSGNYPLDVRKIWGPLSVKVKTNDVNTTSNWALDEEFDDKVVIDSSNPFQTVYGYSGQKEVGIRLKVSKLKEDTITDVVQVQGDQFVTNTQISDLSFYRSVVAKSNDSSPEHEITYVNEIQENDKKPTVENLTLVGLSLKAGESYTALDQMRVWLSEGIKVKRLHPNKSSAYGDSANQGPSSLLTDLVYYLLTDQIAGAGGLLNQSLDNNPLVDKDELIKTAEFLHAEELYFNGSVVQRTNLRQFISEIAPFFLCNFAIKNGKFTLMPALPTDGKNRIESGPVQVDQLFTGGNILENTFKVEYLGAEERRPFVAVVRYRQERPNEFPEEKVLTVKGGSAYNENSLTELPQETFDLTQFCTSEEHAIKVAKYFLILRRFVSHTISFSTTVDGLNIGVGSFIKVSTESNPYNSANNGTIDENGSITSVRTLTDGFYDIEYYSASLNDDVASAKMQVSNGTVSDSTLFDSVFTLSNKSVSSNIYIIEQLTFSQEGTVDIVASEHVCDSSDRSRLVDEFLNGSFTVS
jgi:hypothetical protein